LQTSSTQCWATGLSLLSVTQRHLLENFVDFFNTELGYRFDTFLGHTETSVGFYRFLQHRSGLQVWHCFQSHRDICWRILQTSSTQRWATGLETAFSHTETSTGEFCKLLQHRAGLQVCHCFEITQRHLLEDFADFFNTELDYRFDTVSVGWIL
jgi:hypothetical protein